MRRFGTVIALWCLFVAPETRAQTPASKPNPKPKPERSAVERMSEPRPEVEQLGRRTGVE